MKFQQGTRVFRYAVMAAVVLGLALGWFIQSFTASPLGQVAEVSTVVAARYIPAGTVLSPDILRVIKLPAASVPSRSVRAPDEVLGRLTKTAIMPGEPILLPRLVPVGSEAKGIRLPIITALGDYVSGWFAELCYLGQRLMTARGGGTILFRADSR